jgi:hypothetical protein
MYQRLPFDTSGGKDENETQSDFNKRKKQILLKRLRDENFEIIYEEENTKDIPYEGRGLSVKYSVEIENLVKALLERDPTKRLGSTNGSKEILEHDAFRALR